MTDKYLTDRTVLLTLTNKLDEECNIKICYERSYDNDGMIFTHALSSSFHLENNESCSVRINDHLSYRSMCVLNHITVTLKHSYTRIKFDLHKDANVDIIAGEHHTILTSISPYNRSTTYTEVDTKACGWSCTWSLLCGVGCCWYPIDITREAHNTIVYCAVE